MSAPMRTHRTNGTVKVSVGGRNPKLFLVPKKAAESVVELLRPYAQRDERTVAAAEVFGKHYAKHGAHEGQEKQEKARHRIGGRHVITGIYGDQKPDSCAKVFEPCRQNLWR